MQLFALGINHHTAPLAVREQVSFDLARLPQALHDLLRAKPVREAAILSTCNRTELYCAADRADGVADWGAPCGTCSASPPASIPWCWASRRSSAR